MGVVYKLTPEVSSFIIEQKQNDPKITCQNLAGTVFLKFGQKVSKSSVHELLKQAHVITPRPRKKIKDKFQIPLDKKVEISKALEPFRIVQEPVQKEILAVQTIEESPKPGLTEASGDIFLKSALWDLSLKPVLGLNDYSNLDAISMDQKMKMEWEYLNQPIDAIKIETEAGVVYIDPRFQGIYSQNPNQQEISSPIERAAYEMTDCILNNINALIIRGNSNTLFSSIYELITIFENVSPMKTITLTGPGDLTLAEFSKPLAYRRKFILGLSSQMQEIQEAIQEPHKEAAWSIPLRDKNTEQLNTRLLKKNNKIVVTNIMTDSYEEIWKKYDERHPDLNFKVSLSSFRQMPKEQASSLKNLLKERALIFFPQEFTWPGLEEVVNLAATQEISAKEIKVYLQVPASFSQKQNLAQGIDQINNLHIKDSQGRIVRIFCHE